MNDQTLMSRFDAMEGILPLDPQLVGRFYGDLNRLGQRLPGAPRPDYFRPERWIGSSTRAVNPPQIPSSGLSTCAALSDPGQPPLTLKDLLAHEALGPKLLGAQRYAAHDGRFLVLLKLLDPMVPIPFHVHANDAFVNKHPSVYPHERFGKDEAYHFLDAPKGPNPYTHLGLHPGVTVKDVIAAMRRGEDHVLELSPSAYQNYGEGFQVDAGLLHRPGTALTLEIQQPSDVYTMFQLNFGPDPLDPAALHPGFESIEQAAEAVVTLSANLKPDLLHTSHLKPSKLLPEMTGGVAEWIFPPEASPKYCGMRLTVETHMPLRFKQPTLLFVWQGSGQLRSHTLTGRRGHPTGGDEFFISLAALEEGLTLTNTGDQPLTAFALFAASI